MDFEALTDEEYSNLPEDQKMVERLMQVAEYLEARQLTVISPEEDHLYFPMAEVDVTNAPEEQKASVAPPPVSKRRVSQTTRKWPKGVRGARSDGRHRELGHLGALILQANLAKTANSVRALVKAGKVHINGRAARSLKTPLSIGDEVVVATEAKARARKGYYGGFGKVDPRYKKRKTASQITFVVGADPSKKTGMSLQLDEPMQKAASKGRKATSADQSSSGSG